MGNHLDMIRGRQVVIPLTNKSGETCVAGTLVIMSDDYDESFDITTIEGDERVIGVTEETILDDESGRIVCSGYAPVVLVDEAVTRGDYLVPSTTSGKAAGKADAAGLGVLGIALESGSGSVAAYLFHTVRGSQGVTGAEGPQGYQGSAGPQGDPGPSAGNDTEVIFNDSGVGAGDAGMTYNKTTDTLTLAGRIEAANADMIKVSANDTTSGYAETKIVAGDGISIAVADDGADETLVITNSANIKTVVMSRAGEITDEDSYAFRIYPGIAGTIVGVRIAVFSAPVGASIKVDVNKNGVTIFTDQDNRPEIAALAYTGITEEIDVTEITASDYLGFDVDQVGSTISGGYLTVHVYIEVD